MISCFDVDGAGVSGGGGAGADGPDGDARRAAKPRKGRGRGSGEGGCSAGPVRVEVQGRDDRFALGAPSVVRKGAPDPEGHPAGRTDAEIRELFERKSRIREQGIQQVLEQEKARGGSVERFVAAIRYDSELAPRTTNRRQLLELGIEVPAGDALPTDPDQVRRVLWTIIYGLARLGIFLTGTNSYGDRELLERLCSRVLVDEVSDIPPSGDLSEFIDLTPPPAKAQDPDGLVGPFEYEPQSEDDELETRKPRSNPPSVVERDAYLPRPDRR